MNDPTMVSASDLFMKSFVLDGPAAAAGNAACGYGAAA
jgi:hypothetical protein